MKRTLYREHQLSLFDRVPPFPSPRFGGHHGQPPRWVWLKKVVDAVAADNWCFSLVDACLSFGVTARRLESMVFWGTAFKLIIPDGNSGRYVVSTLGQRLLLENGADPWLENPFSFWLLQWELLQPPCYPQVWEWCFRHFHQTPFLHEEALQQLERWAREQEHTVAPSTLASDLDCLLKMYRPDSRLPLEDQLLLPFPALGLLWQEERSTPVIHFEMGRKPGLSPAAVAYFCADYLCRLEWPGSTVGLRGLTYDVGSPGQVFRLGRYELETNLDAVCQQSKHLYLDSTAGLVQLAWTTPLEELRAALWRQLFDRASP